MIRTLTALAVLGLAATPLLAEGDAANGEKVFKQCQTCHVVAAPDGTLLAGKAGKTGPNLYGVVGRPAGSYPDFNYGDSMLAANAKGLVWNEEEIVAYVHDPSAFLKEYLGDPKARGKMTFKLAKEQDAHDVVAYLISLAPPAQ
jgi:cytochrome c